MYTYNGSILKVNGCTLGGGIQPVGANTLRFRFDSYYYNPNNESGWATGSTWKRVSFEPNVWDYKFTGTSLENAFLNRFQTLNTYLIGSSTTGVTNMSHMFDGCTLLRFECTLDTSSVTNMSSMFNGCSMLQSIGNFDTSSVTDMSSMFDGCSMLQSIGNLNTSRVTDMRYMLRGCSSLQSLPAFTTSRVRYVTEAFKGCENVGSGARSIYNSLSSRGISYNDYRDAFKDCGIKTSQGRADLRQIPYSWGGYQISRIEIDTTLTPYQDEICEFGSLTIDDSSNVPVNSGSYVGSSFGVDTQSQLNSVDIETLSTGGTISKILKSFNLVITGVNQFPNSFKMYVSCSNSLHGTYPELTITTQITDGANRAYVYTKTVQLSSTHTSETVELI